MSEKAFDVYQGSGWMTHRWTAAQVFDTLDRVRELCAPAAVSALPQMMGSASLPRYEAADESRADVFAAIAELLDDLEGELDALGADLFSHLQGDAAGRWAAFEMRLHLKEMREIALYEHQADEPSGSGLDAILSLAARMRDLLKHIDQ